jgi:hypothetical protein
MLQRLLSFVLLILLSPKHALTQTSVQPGTLETKTGLLNTPTTPDKLPDIIADVKSRDAGPEKRSRKDFLKDWAVTSFGYGPAPTSMGFEFRSPAITNTVGGPGLECPVCIARPTSDRVRFTLPAFGAQAVKMFANDRVELSTGFGGVNAWSANGATILLSPSPVAPFRAPSPNNDEWLLQVSGGARVAVDNGRHIWLGIGWRSVWDTGPPLPRERSWTALSGSVTFVTGR